MRKIFADPFRVEAGFVHADKTDGREVVIERAEITLGIGIKSRVEQFGDGISLYFERTGGDIHHLGQTLIEFVLVLGKIGDARHIDGYYADRTRAFAASEEPAALLSQFSEVKTQTAAHGTHVARLHIGIDVVGKIRRAVFCGHFEKQLIVFRFRPVEIARDGIRRNRILEAAAVGVALDHDFDKRLVDHRHFLDAILIFEIHFLAADDRGKFRKVVGDHPIEGDVGERRLRAPARRGVDAVNERLNALFDFLIRQIIHLDKRRKVGIEGGKRLRPRPFVLHDAEEVHHLIAEGGKMRRGRTGDLAGNAAEPFHDELFERPTRAVPREHGQIVNMNIRIAVRLVDFVVINFGQPVVRRDRAGVA